jgi:RimJ/RimL family protein N-acetyltransferase
MPQLVDYDINFLNKSWEWLNDQEIRELTLVPSFTKKDQLSFYKNLSQKKDYWIKGIQENGLPIGAMGLKCITDESAEYWGYIGEKAFWGKGIGKFILGEALKKAKQLNLSTLYLNVGSKNVKAKNLYIKTGFKIVSKGEIERYEIEL